MEQKETQRNTIKSFWQSALWDEILSKTGQAEILHVTQDNELILIERRKIWGKYSGLYILGIDQKLVSDDLLHTIRDTLLQPHDLFLQIEPLTKMKNEEGRMKNTTPFRRFLEPVTAMLDLKPPCQELVRPLAEGEENQEGNQGVFSEDALFASFAEKGRYNIRLAQKRGVTTRWVKASEIMYNVECAENNGDKDSTLNIEHGTLNIEKTYIEAFYDLLDETTKRDGFSHNSLSYYQQFVETLETHNAGGLLIAEKDGIFHAAGIFVYPSSQTPLSRGVSDFADGGFNESENLPITVGITPPGEGRQGGVGIYYYGASSSNPIIRRDMATYLLQWEAIREAMRRGCSEYDFLGISEDGKGKLAGVTEFKMRFHPEKVYLSKEIVQVFKPTTLIMLQFMSRLTKFFRSW